jgi:hypothetical protein
MRNFWSKGAKTASEFLRAEIQLELFAKIELNV